MAKKLLSVGFEIPGGMAKYVPFRSDQSLLDADVIIFQPEISGYHLDYPSNYQGKPCYDSNSSFAFKEDSEHWYSELSVALNEGKTVVVLFSKYEEVFVHTGEKKVSGTGRSQKVTAMVTPANNYEFLPIDLPTIIPKGGDEIVFIPNPIFANLWKDFRECMHYESYLDDKIENSLFLTKTGNKTIGAIFKLGKGHLVLLPPIDYDVDEFVDYDEETEDEVWTREANQFGKRLLQVIIDIDEGLRRSQEKTPPPDWSGKSKYQLKEETALRKKILKTSKHIKELTEKKNILLEQLEGSAVLRDLLFEKGILLERAVIEALGLLGYQAESYDDGVLEIDQVILSPEGHRMIGETEGKDNLAVGIDKFRQLESNIQEDFNREEIKEPALGVLFGNGFRLTNPEVRECQFTEKCLLNAERLGVALVQTPNLFQVARYLKEQEDDVFAKKCRESIVKQRGKVVVFPELPKT